MIDAARYQQAKAIFFAACERPPTDREKFITDSCQDDGALRQAVLDLLKQDADPLSLNESSRWRAHLEALADSSESAGTARPRGDAAADSAPPYESIGGYRLIRQIGRGGMGVVYLAEQDNPRRQVALKVMAPGPISPATLRRFKQEAQVLGRLHHPGIAQIFEAGTYDAGHGSQPYFAMELVLGRPLLKYCDEAGLGVRARLEMFIAICEALEHAHQQGVIHRDLKPANILIDEAALPPRPKILDFGVARANGGDLAHSTMHTRADQLIGTVAYMSPEQLDGGSDSLDRRSDVYALGVILFELLSGRLPHDLTGKSMPETVRIVGQEEPTMLGTIDRSYRGDVDTIVAKTLERDRLRRYESAGALAADLRRYLADEPILARPPSTMYQFRKFARRNRTLMAGVAAVFVALAAGLATTAWQAREAIRARDEQITLRKKADDNATLARSEAAKAVAANEFVRRMLSSANPEVTQDRDISVREVLDSAATDITRGSLASQPDVEALVDLIIGESYLSLGRTEEARRHFTRSLETSKRHFGERSDEVATALIGLASTSNAEGDYSKAIAVAQDALTMFRSIHAGDDDQIANVLSNLAEYHSSYGEQEVSLSLKTESMEMLRRLHGDQSVPVADAQARIAAMLHNSEAAEPHVRASLEAYRTTIGETTPKYVQAMGRLAGVLMMRGRYDEAEATLNRSLELGEQVFGHDHATNLVTLSNLAFCHTLAGHPEKSLSAQDRSVDMARRLYGEDSMRLVGALLDRANCHGTLGHHAQADADQRECLAICRRLRTDHEHLPCLARLKIAEEVVRGVSIGRLHDLQEARTLMAEILAIEGTKEPARVWIRGACESVLGEMEMLEGNFDHAEQLLLQGFEHIGTGRLVIVHRRAAAGRLIRLYEAWQQAEPDKSKVAKIEKWKTMSAELNASKRPATTAPG